jgi:hypothetical protein
VLTLDCVLINKLLTFDFFLADVRELRGELTCPQRQMASHIHSQSTTFSRGYMGKITLTIKNEREGRLRQAVFKNLGINNGSKWVAIEQVIEPWNEGGKA